jgi:hypothetical protein
MQSSIEVGMESKKMNLYLVQLSNNYNGVKFLITAKNTEEALIMAEEKKPLYMYKSITKIEVNNKSEIKDATYWRD